MNRFVAVSRPRGAAPACRVLSMLALALALPPGEPFTASAADLSIKPGDQIIRVDVQNAEQLQALLDLDLDIHSHEVGVGPVDVHVSTAEREAIGQLGMKFEVLNPDLMASYAREQADILLGQGLAVPFDSYLNIDNTYQFMTNLAIARPDLVEELPAIGLSIESRPLRVWRITGPDKTDKPGAFFHGLQHCREWITGPMILYIANQLVTNYDGNPAIQSLVNRTDFYLMPVMNPDGYAYTWIDSSTRLWRKNRRLNAGGTFGVDLNRNWAFGWSGPGASSVPSNDTYYGTGPFSEPESAAVSNFILSKPNIRAHMDYHSYSQLIMWAYGANCTTLPQPDYGAYYEMGQDMHRLIREATSLFYEPGPICQTIYQASGASVDWTYATAGRTSMTIELRDTGTNGFTLPANQILPNCQENFPAIMRLTEWATAGVVIVVKDAPPVLRADTPTVVKFKVYESGEGYVPNSATLYYRAGDSGSFTAVPASHVSGVDFTATIPAIPCGLTVEYYFRADGSDGFMAQNPNGFPVSQPEPEVYTARVVNQIVLEDHFQTDLGWTATVVGATAGQWQRAVPTNDLAVAFDPQFDSDGSGMCFVTQNGTGTNTDVDSGSVRLTSPPLDLSGGDVRISYDYFLYLSNVAGGVDRMLVEIDSNNGAGPWTQIALHVTSGGVSWRRHTITQTNLDLLGVTLTSAMRIRSTVNDSNPQSTVEGGLDNVRISVGTCPVPKCPGTLGDMDSDSLLNGGDIAGFSAAFITESGFDPCADLAEPFGTLDDADIAAFTALLLGQ